MDARVIPLKYRGTCRCCGCALPAGAKAWWEASTKTVTCLECHATEAVEGESAQAGGDVASVTPIDVGVAGASAKAEHDRRVAKRDRQIEDKWGTGRLGRFVKAVSDEPQSTKAWATGSDGEVRLGRRLDKMAEAWALHDRQVPNGRGNIDHLVVASSGVWVVDAKSYTGLVERRDVGRFFSTDHRLYVNGRDRTSLVSGLAWQVAAVRDALEGLDDVPVRPALCFTDSEWSWFAKPFDIDDVLVAWPSRLVELISKPGELTPEAVERFARHLSSQLPSCH